MSYALLKFPETTSLWGSFLTRTEAEEAAPLIYEEIFGKKVSKDYAMEAFITMELQHLPLPS